jgi:hypothetical protein
VASAPAERHTKLIQHDSGIGMDIPEIVLTKQTTAHDTPFTAEELEQAMTRASLKPRAFGEEDYKMQTTRRRHAIAG